jgi:hypothetical protein
MIEIWKDIPDYEGLYQVSNVGRVRRYVKSKKSYKLNILTIDGTGYYRKKLSKNNNKKVFSVHQLVAKAFLNHKPNGMNLVIDHINNDKLDNRVENLQIVTQRFNVYKTQGNYSSDYKGVCWNKHAKKWRSAITIKGKRKILGYFENEYDAHLAYEKALQELVKQ